MDIVKEFSEKHPIAWSVFMEWADEKFGDMPYYDNMLEFTHRENLGSFPLILQLTILQAWLDSVAGKEDRLQELYKEIDKGLEIFEQTH